MHVVQHSHHAQSPTQSSCTESNTFIMHRVQHSHHAQSSTQSSSTEFNTFIMHVVQHSHHAQSSTQSSCTEFNTVIMHIVQHSHHVQSPTQSSCTESNTVIMHRFQSKTLTTITNVPLYVTNHTLHRDCNILYVSDVIHERINKNHNKLEAHPNPLLEPPLQPVNNRRLKRCWPLDLQGTWGDIAGWTPYHDIVIHHHTRL
jgi:hypothetical protein